MLGPVSVDFKTDFDFRKGSRKAPGVYGAVGSNHSMLHGVERYGAVHSAGVDVAVADFAGKGFGDSAFARG